MHAERRLLPGHGAVPRWHFQHGPIDLVIVAEGDAAAVAEAHAAAWRRFETALPELVDELRALRLPVVDLAGPCPFQGAIARRMWRACRPFHAQFITPMAAVAGAVAQELIAAYQREGIRRAWVNNGGDIALHLAPGASTRVGVFADLARFDPTALTGPTSANTTSLRTDAGFTVHASMPVRGIATSGWRGRSFSLGIADSVTVLARTAAEADAAATMIANAVDVDDPRIVRRPASTLKDDSDLGDLLVTVDVPPLDAALVGRALDAGLARADALRDRGLITACAMVCQGALRTVGRDRLWHGPRFSPLTLEAA